MKNLVAHPVLLPNSRHLRIKSSGAESVVVEFPDWLADYCDKKPEDFLGKPVEMALEPIFPGVSELIGQTRNNSRPLSGFKSFLTDKNGEKHKFVLESVSTATDTNEKLTSIYIQELPDNIPAKLAQAKFCGLVGASEAMQKVFNKITMYARSDAPVLVTGETGAGKEGVAAAIHQQSLRSEQPFITMNCSAITETLFESELFGHEKGSFTGALTAHRGRFERANGGTLFLDEIGDLPPLSQAKLLRALETSQIERVGSEKTIKVDVRIIAATNRNLEEASQKNEFRPDLFYRINALQINVPPLKSRPEDIELLIEHFIQILNKKYDRKVVCLTREAMQLLKQYQWPGNVRELRNLLERLFAENQTDVISLRALKEWYDERMAAAKYATVSNDYQDVTILPYQKAIPLGMPHSKRNNINNGHNSSNGSNLDKETLQKAYNQADGNITKASALLGIHKATFYRTLKSLGLTREDLQQ